MSSTDDGGFDDHQACSIAEIYCSVCGRNLKYEQHAPNCPDDDCFT